jgi:hypothetical protein
MRTFGDVQSFFRRQGAPVTVCLISAIVGVSVLLFLFHSLGEFLILLPDTVAHPWVYLTYPFVNNLADGWGVVGMLFLSYWLFWVGSSAERDLGSLRFGLLWAVASVVSAVCVLAGGMLLRTPFYAMGGLLPVSVLSVIWGVRNRTASVMMMAILPISGFWLAWLSVAIVFVDYGRSNLGLGVAACVPLAIGWAFADNRIPGLVYGKPKSVYRPSKAQRAKEAAFFDDVAKREQERKDRERLRKLFEGSIEDK